MSDFTHRTARRSRPKVDGLSDEELSELLADCRDERRERLGAQLSDTIECVAVGGRLVTVVGLKVQRWEKHGEYGWEPTDVYLATSPGEDSCEIVNASSVLTADEYAVAVRAVTELWDLEGSCARPGAVTWVNDKVFDEQVLTFFDVGGTA